MDHILIEYYEETYIFKQVSQNKLLNTCAKLIFAFPHVYINTWIWLFKQY